MANDVAVNYLTVTKRDYSGEDSSSGFNLAQQVDNATYISARDALIAQIDAITNGTTVKFAESKLTRQTNNMPSDETSARETKMLVSYEDTVTFKRYSVSIPTFDRTTVTMIQGTDLVDPVSLAGFITAFEGAVVSPDGNPVNVLESRFVGRNN